MTRRDNQNFYLLNVNEETKKVFLPRPMVSFGSLCKISSHLVRGKLYPLDRVGMQEHLLKYFNSMRHNVFLNNV